MPQHPGKDFNGGETLPCRTTPLSKVLQRPTTLSIEARGKWRHGLGKYSVVMPGLTLWCSRGLWGIWKLWKFGFSILLFFQLTPSVTVVKHHVLKAQLLNYSTHHIWLLLSQHDIPHVMSRSRLALIRPQANCICQASPPLRLMDWYFITLIPPVKPTPLSTHPPSPLASYGLDEIQTLCGSILKWPNSVSRRAKWKVVKSFEPLLHYNSSKHIQLGPKFREDIKALLHVTLEDDNSWAPLKLLRKSTIKGPKGRTPHTSYWLLMGWVYQTQPIWQSLYLL